MAMKMQILAAALVLGFGLSAASAATINATFDFTGGQGHGQGYSQTQGGLDLTVDAARYNGVTKALTGNARVTWNGNGLGARSGANDTSPRLDGDGANEILSFFFSKVVKIEQITFVGIAKGSRADLFLNSLFQASGSVLPLLDLSGNMVTADTFGVGVRRALSSFRIASVTVSYDDSLPAVPLPAGALLLASGLGMIGLLRRKRAAA
jgi:hypothetical protein